MRWRPIPPRVKRAPPRSPQATGNSSAQTPFPGKSPWAISSKCPGAPPQVASGRRLGRSRAKAQPSAFSVAEVERLPIRLHLPKALAAPRSGNSRNLALPIPAGATTHNQPPIATPRRLRSSTLHPRVRSGRFGTLQNQQTLYDHQSTPRLYVRMRSRSNRLCANQQLPSFRKRGNRNEQPFSPIGNSKLKWKRGPRRRFHWRRASHTTPSERK